MEGLFLGDRFEEDDDGNTVVGPQYSHRAIADVALYRLVKIGGYTEDDLESRISDDFAARLLRADTAFLNARAEQKHRATPRE